MNHLRPGVLMPYRLEHIRLNNGDLPIPGVALSLHFCKSVIEQAAEPAEQLMAAFFPESRLVENASGSMEHLCREGLWT